MGTLPTTVLLLKHSHSHPDNSTLALKQTMKTRRQSVEKKVDQPQENVTTQKDLDQQAEESSSAVDEGDEAIVTTSVSGEEVSDIIVSVAKPLNHSIVRSERSEEKESTTSKLSSSSSSSVAMNRGTKSSNNPLSKFRPGYTAPMQLAAPSLNKFVTSTGGLESLRKQAMKKDYKAVLDKSNSLRPPSISSFSSYSKTSQFMVDPSTDPTLAQDLHLIRHRNYLNPKRFYKNPDMPSKWVQRGTYIEEGRKVRQGTLVEQILQGGTQHEESGYVKRKYQTMQQELQEKSKKRRGRNRKFK